MVKQQNFDELVAAIQKSFLQCGRLAERQHIEMLSGFFDSENKPVSIPFRMPQFDDSGNVTYQDVSIPKLCLVPISSLKLDGVKVDFKVRLTGAVSLEEKKEDSGKEPVEERRSFLGYLPGGGRGRNPDDFANITLQFASQEPPEGIMRIQDELIRVTL
ncbi:MAG: DUF2589 domain-containing protein [Roseburia sp.]|nr:DUF2589 domain-containing protein [Roseburia sp.]